MGSLSRRRRNKKSPLPEQNKATQKPQPDYKAITSKSQDISAQCNKLWALLGIKEQSTYDLRALGISHPGMRVKDLAAFGSKVFVRRAPATDEAGFKHSGVAWYSRTNTGGAARQVRPSNCGKTDSAPTKASSRTKRRDIDPRQGNLWSAP